MKSLSIYFGHHSLVILNSFLNILNKYNISVLNKHSLEQVICFIHKFVLAIFWGPRVEEPKHPLVGTAFDEKPFDKNKHYEFDCSSAVLFSSENRTDKKPCVFCGFHSGTISVNTVIVNTILQFVLLIKISSLDLTIGLKIIW